MNTSITARHCEISDELRSRAETVLERLANHLPSPIDATVVFDVAPQASAEIRINGGRDQIFVATGEDRDHRSALDRAEEKIRRQMDKDNTALRRERGAKDAV
ncbi:MAG: HPF/RaiA family ribosome-associated protein [Gemmatimonadales bacterium]